MSDEKKTRKGNKKDKAMPELRETYKGVEISIREDEETFQLKIGGKPIKWAARTRSGKYEAAPYPYARFESALELAIFIIDRSDWK